MIAIAVNLSTPITANIDLLGVTPAQIGAAHKVFGPDNLPFYLVENSQGDVNDAGELIEYRVTFTDGHISCTCPAGQHGFARCKDGRFCWHVRAALACENEVREAVAEQERYQAEQAVAQATEIIAQAQAPKPVQAEEPTIEQLQAVAKDILVDGKPCDIGTAYRVMTAEPKKTNKHQKGINRKPFSILR